jgi:hypothetical protein
MSRFPSAQLAKGNTDNIAIAMASVPPSQKLQEFLRFPDLPMEIRFKIWKLSLPGKDLTELLPGRTTSSIPHEVPISRSVSAKHL